MELTARSLVLDLIAAVRSGEMPVSALVASGALFGFEENNIRVSLSKLCASGRVERAGPGHYRLSDETAASARELRGWRNLERSHGRWREDWIAVHCPRLGRGVARRRRERALDVFGFRGLDPGLYVRPNNLRGGVPSLRQRFLAIVPDGNVEGPLIYGMRDLPLAIDDRARALWDVDALSTLYRQLIDVMATSRKRLPRLSKEQALVETFTIGGRVVRSLVVDPLLPEAMMDGQARRAVGDAMKAYDVIGHERWAAFLAEQGVPGPRPTAWSTTYGVEIETPA